MSISILSTINKSYPIKSAQKNFHCGVSTHPNPSIVDNGGFGWVLLGCCIPIVGLILFLVWKDTKPKTSKAAGIGALVSVIVMVLLYALIFLLGVVGAASSY